METRRKMKLGTSDRIILGVGYTLLGLFVLAVFVPLVYVVLASFMDPNVLNNQGISFDFKDWTLDAYKRVLENDMIWRGFAKLILLFGGIYRDLGICYTSSPLTRCPRKNLSAENFLM